MAQRPILHEIWAKYHKDNFQRNFILQWFEVLLLAVQFFSPIECLQTTIEKIYYDIFILVSEGLDPQRKQDDF